MFTGWVYDLLKPLAEDIKVAHPEILKTITVRKRKMINWTRKDMKVKFLKFRDELPDDKLQTSAKVIGSNYPLAASLPSGAGS